MKLKELQGYLETVSSFEKPKVLLEQYPTPPKIAAQLLLTMWDHEDIEDCLVADLGTGCGMLGIGACILGAGHVVGFDIDPAALATAQENVENLEIETLDLVLCDVAAKEETPEPALGKFAGRSQFDTVIMNPPFGTKKNAGMDMLFIKRAMEICHGTVYSLHKTSTREYLLRNITRLGGKPQVIAELRYNVENSYRFHKKKSVDIAVDFIRIDCRDVPRQPEGEGPEED